MIYFDNAATTSVDKEVAQEIYKILLNSYGNPSSIYDIGLDAKEIIDLSKNKIGRLLNVNPQDIFFTSGATESNNWVLQYISNKYPKGHIITSSIEHPSVLNTCKKLQEQGYKITFLNVNKNGIIDIQQLNDSITKDTVLISVMSVNNEIGSIQPIQEIGEIAHRNNILFHVDNTQGIYIDFDIEKCHIDYLSMSGHKFHAPKGVGFLYAKNNNIGNLLYGGHQFNGMRPGTENVPYIHGIAVAFEKLYINREKAQKHIILLNNVIRKELKKIGAIFNSDNNSHIVNFQLPINNEELLLKLNVNDINVSIGSACNSGNKSLSYVLQSIGLTNEQIKKSIRVSFCQNNSFTEIKQFLSVLKNILG